MVTRGKGLGLVTRTGKHTYLGNLLLHSRRLFPPRTPLQTDLRALAARLTLFALFASCLAALIGAARSSLSGSIEGGSNWKTVLLTALSLCFATIPEELPLLIAGVLAVGASTLAHKGIYVKSLSAQEGLAYVDVVLTDKTGTLTENRLSLAEIALPSAVVGGEEEEEEEAEGGGGWGERQQEQKQEQEEEGGGASPGKRRRRREERMLREEGGLDALLETWAFTSSSASLPPSQEGEGGGGGGTPSEKEGGKEGGREGGVVPTLVVQEVPDVFDRAVYLSYLLTEEPNQLLSAEVLVEGGREGGREGFV
jgi:magnesium-transporting ATPase (P-type)